MPAPITNGESGSSVRTKINTAFTELAAAQSDITARQLTSEKGQANGYAGLDATGKVPSAQLPSFVDDVIEAANFAALPGTGETSKIYVTINDNKSFRWSGSAYVEISASPGSTDAVTEGATNLYFTAARVRAVVLTGLSTATNAVIAATDTILVAIGKLQAQINDKISASAATTITATKAVLVAADKFISIDSAASDVPKLTTLAELNNSLGRLAAGTGLGTTGTVNLDLAALAGTEQQITATGNITFTTSNRAAGLRGRLRIAAGGSTRTLTWPSWTAFGVALPTSLASGKVLRVAWDCTGTTDASVDVAVVESV